MTSKQTQHGTAVRTCTSCGRSFSTWPGDDEPMCNPCIIASFAVENSLNTHSMINSSPQTAELNRGARDGDR